MATPLTRSQWSKRKDRGSWTYERYRRYWNKQQTAAGNRGSADAAATGDYFTPRTEPYLAAQAARDARAAYQPQINALNASFEASRKAGTASITGLTSTLMDRVSGLDAETRRMYEGAKAEQSTINQALTNYLGASGAQAELGLAAQLRQAGLGAAMPHAQQLSAYGSGAAATQLGLGASTASRLVSEGAAAEQSAKDLPALFALQGTRSGRLLNAQINKDKGAAVSELTAKIPEAAMTLKQQLLDRELDRAIARRGFELDASGQYYDYQAAVSGDQTSAANSAAATDRNDADNRAAIYRQRVAKMQDGYASARDLAASLKSGKGRGKLSGVNGPPVEYEAAWRQVYNEVKGQFSALQPPVPEETVVNYVRQAMSAGGYLRSDFPAWYRRQMPGAGPIYDTHPGGGTYPGGAAPGP